MKKYIIMAMAAIPFAAFAQSPIDAYQISQNDLKGTARFMSMGGAFGALGADLSALSQNPGGIGVYRSNELGFSVDLDFQSATTNYQGLEFNKKNTKFYLNNIGGVATMRLNNRTFPNINIGFTYNKGASFDRSYRGGIGSLKTSLSNYIAGIANSYELTEGDVQSDDNYDPYNPPAGSVYVPWSAVLGYDSYLISPEGNPNQPNWQGQFGTGTSGSGHFDVRESGSLDEYNIAIGGNIANVLYWGMNFDIVSVNYDIYSLWGENLQNAYVFNPDANRVQQMNADWNLTNLYNVNGSGFNYQLGFIVKPIQELRLGVAFHTPTFFNLTENFYAEQVDYNYPFKDGNYYATTNDGEPTYNKVNFRTPWKVIVSAAGVIGNKAIISMDYEWNSTRNMKYTEANSYGYGWDDWNDWDYYSYTAPSPEHVANNQIKVMYRNTNTIRVGAEYRVLPSLSIRAGYSWTSSPITKEAKDQLTNIPTAGTLANFRLDNSTQYVTCGLGYRYKSWYIDAAYVWKHMTSNYQPFAADPANVGATLMNPKVTFNNSQLVLSTGFRF